MQRGTSKSRCALENEIVTPTGCGFSHVSLPKLLSSFHGPNFIIMIIFYYYSYWNIYYHYYYSNTNFCYVPWF